MRARLAWTFAVLLAGCDQVFDLTPLAELPYVGQVVQDPDGDADGDGEPNATDLCALVPATVIGGRSDRDGDGVGDLCDPAPDTGGNCMVLFDSFESGALSPHWQSEGEQVHLEGSKLVT